MKASIGRIVHFQPLEGDGEAQAALITKVGMEGEPDTLSVFDPKILYPMTLRAKFSTVPSPGFWSWPPRVDA